jgi:hypothetical protein
MLWPSVSAPAAMPRYAVGGTRRCHLRVRETITSHQVRPGPGIEERRERVECVSRQAMTKNPSELLRHPTDMADDDVRHPDEPIELLDQPKATRWRMKQRFRRAQRNIPRTSSTQQAPRYK